MRTLRSLRLVLTLAVAFSVSGGSRAEVIDNSAIKMMAAAGLPENTLVLLIERSEVSFQLETDHLISLHEAGVPESVLVAMIDRARAMASPMDSGRAAADSEPLSFLTWKGEVEIFENSLQISNSKGRQKGMFLIPFEDVEWVCFEYAMFVDLYVKTRSGEIIETEGGANLASVGLRLRERLPSGIKIYHDVGKDEECPEETP